MLERIRRAWRWWTAFLDALGTTSPSRLYLGPMGPQGDRPPKAPPHPYRAPGACTCEARIADLERRLAALEEHRAAAMFDPKTGLMYLPHETPTMGDVARGRMTMAEYVSGVDLPENPAPILDRIG